ncbi:MAG: DUF4493 domain-containing protein [Muribaculaceae bacterium]|nr:DUF4493 domain-containing protein [Muribaculaceae bacterium]
MKNFSKGLLLLAAAVSSGLVSCSDESPWRGSDSEGGINLNFSSDARVMRQTRADDNVSPVVPDADRFGVNLSKSDGSYSKTWTSVEAFNRETSFPMGDYTLTASYGDIEEEGFTSPCYKGQAGVHVSPGAVTDVKVVATLANAMVSIRYTDEFKAAFAAYSSSIQTEGHSWVVFAQDEDRPAYVAPSEVRLDLRLTNDEGKVVNIEPASFTALARHHYVVTIGVSANSATGDLALDIQFDDDVVADVVAVSLGDDLFNAPAPSVKTKGFETGTALDAFEYAAFKGEAQFDVFAFGGLRTATINVIGDNGYTPAFGRSAQLVNADALLQAQLASEGIDCAGFFRNVDKMGVVNLTGFISKLPAGSYTIELQVSDAMTRVSDPVSLSVAVTPVSLEVESNVTPSLLDTEVSIDVATNCADIRDEVTFKAPNAANQLVDAKVKSVSQLSSPAGAATRSSLPYVFRYVIEVAPVTRTELNIETTLGRRTVRTVVMVGEPEFSVTPDAFARQVMLRVEAASDETAAWICDNMQVYDGETAVPSASVSHAADGIVAVSGLQPATLYDGFNVRVGDFRKDVPAFTTEAEAQIPNGNFSSITQTINFSGIQVGGKYEVNAGLIKASYAHTSSIVRSTPDNWATLNDLTCWSGSANKNTWFMVPSAFAENGTVVVRSVGYHHNGTTPPNSGGNFNTKYYCENAPSVLDCAAGELFLGSYSYDGSENRSDGIVWSTRPTTLNFKYKYTSVGEEQGEVYVRVLGEDGLVLAEKIFLVSASSDMTEQTVNISGYPFGQKAVRLELGFKSTRSGITPTINIPSGTALNEGQQLGNKTIPANSYKAFAKGSELTVSDVRLGYGSAAAANAPRRSAGKR